MTLLSTLHPSIPERRPDEPLATALADALACGRPERVTDLEPVDTRDAVLALLQIHDLHVAPLGTLRGRERLQHHPAVAQVKWRLEQQLLALLEEADAEAGWDLPPEPVAAIRAIAVRDLTPAVYRWVAEDAGWDELVAFLTLEGGPDGGFDDLVAACQIGLSGEPKLELAQNYWDEMGNGSLAAVHTELHRDLARAVGMQPLPREWQPTEALLRSALGTYLATNRWLQPEMVGALGLIELQAGPRCRKVVAALERLDAPAEALPFYVEHASVDPRHGKDWLDHVITPLADDERFAEGMVRGARWRSLVNGWFFEAMAERFAP